MSAEPRLLIENGAPARHVASAIWPFGEFVRPRENISLASQTTEWRMPRKRPRVRREAHPKRN